MPAVGVEGRTAFRALCDEAGVGGDSAGRDVRRRMVQLDPVQPEGREGPCRHRGQRPSRDATTTCAWQHPVRDLGQAITMDDATQADLPHDSDSVKAAAEHRPPGTGLRTPPLRPGSYPVPSLVIGHRTGMPELNGRIGIRRHDNRPIRRPPRPENDVLRVDLGLLQRGHRAGRQRRLGKERHTLTLCQGDTPRVVVDRSCYALSRNRENASGTTRTGGPSAILAAAAPGGMLG